LRVLQLLLLTIAAAAVTYAQTLLSPLQEAIRIALDLRDNHMALLQGPAAALPLALAGIPLGLLVDRFSRRRLIVVFAMLNLLGTLLTAVAPNFVVLFAARCLVGLAVPAVTTAAISMIADWYPPAQRGRAFMILGIGQVGGMSAAFALGGEILSVYGAGPSSWRWTTLCLSVPLGLVIMSTAAVREPARTEVIAQNASSRAALLELWRYRAVVTPLVGGMVIVSIVNTAAVIWAAPLFARSFALPADQIGKIMAAALLISAIAGSLGGGTLADYCQRSGGPRRTVTALSALTLLNAPAALFAVAPGVASASVLLVVFITLGTAISSMASPICTIAVPNELRGLCVSVVSAVSAPLCLGLAPMMVSLLSGAMGGPAMIGKALTIVCVSTSMIGAAVFAFGRRNFSNVPTQALALSA
jgi:predicted MFS family arabinose efflux permease